MRVSWRLEMTSLDLTGAEMEQLGGMKLEPAVELVTPGDDEGGRRLNGDGKLGGDVAGADWRFLPPFLSILEQQIQPEFPSDESSSNRVMESDPTEQKQPDFPSDQFTGEEKEFDPVRLQSELPSNQFASEEMKEYDGQLNESRDLTLTVFSARRFRSLKRGNSLSQKQGNQLN